MADAKFCAQCGDSLQIVCPVCSFVSPPDANFCSNCGHRFVEEERPRLGQDVTRYVPPEMLTKITAARSTNPMRGERRTVTMLFADIQGSTAAAEGLDPEDWTDIVNGAFEHLIEPVYRYEGTLARLLGDAVLAFFGAPIAHEDDPVRAVRAGLEIVEAMTGYKAEIADRWGLPIDVRVGINTGLVVVGEVGSDLRVEYTALGDAVNVAARMEQTAAPGTVRVTADTWALVSDHFEGEPIGAVEVKGKSEPVEAVRVVGLRREAPAAGATRPLIGRSAELETLQELRDRLLEGAGWVAAVMGEAGVGKSRLLDEFRVSTAAAVSTEMRAGDGGELGWMCSFSESYDASVPYSTVRQLLERWWDLDDAAVPYAAVEGAVEAVIPGVRDAASYLGYVASVPLPESVSGFLDRLEPPVLDARVRATVLAYLEGEARRRPIVLSLEDLHWADPVSLAFIEDVMGLTETVPLGLLFTMRPYRDEPAWLIHEAAQRDHPHRYRALDLTSLDAGAAGRLLDDLLEGTAVADELRQRILARSDGNPLFVEQMARAILEGGDSSDSVPVPTGLSSLLTARLDRLEGESKLVAQVASVIGSEFDRPTLAALVGEEVDVDRRLSDLLRREIFVERRGRMGLLGFHHALMQEAAYSTMLHRTRRELHGRLAEHLAAASPEAVQEVARHFVEAGDMDRAFPHLIAAGEKSSRSMALADAIEFFTTALDNLPATADPELVVRGYDGLGVAYTLVPDLTQSGAAYQRLVDYADTSGRPSAKVTALNRLAINSAFRAGDLAGARQYLDEAFALATETGDEQGLVQCHMNACTIAGLGGDTATSVEHDAATARFGGELGIEEIRVEGLTRLAVNTMWLMDFERAIPSAEQAAEAATDLGDELSLALLDAFVTSRLRMREGDMEAALALLEGSQGTLERYASFYLPTAQLIAAFFLFERGRIDDALQDLETARAIAVEQNFSFYLAVANAGLARIYANLGMETEMREARSAAVEAVNAPLGDFIGSTVWTELGLAALAAGDPAAAGEAFRRGLASSSASKYWEKPRLLIGRASAEVATDDPAAAHRSLDEAQTFLLEKEVRAFDAHVESARGAALLAEGRAAEAAPHLEAALELARAGKWRLLEIETAGTAARAAVALDDPDAARRHVAAARAQVEEMAGALADPELAAAVRAAWSAPLEGIATG